MAWGAIVAAAGNILKSKAVKGILSSKGSSGGSGSGASSYQPPETPVLNVMQDLRMDNGFYGHAKSKGKTDSFYKNVQNVTGSTKKTRK